MVLLACLYLKGKQSLDDVVCSSKVEIWHIDHPTTSTCSPWLALVSAWVQGLSAGYLHITGIVLPLACRLYQRMDWKSCWRLCRRLSRLRRTFTRLLCKVCSHWSAMASSKLAKCRPARDSLCFAVHRFSYQFSKKSAILLNYTLATLGNFYLKRAVSSSCDGLLLCCRKHAL